MFYQGMNDAYGLENTYTVDGDDLISSFNNLSILTSMNKTVVAMYSISQPEGGFSDAVWALASAATGVLKLVVNIFTTPIEVLGLVIKFYPIPGIIITSIVLLIIIYVGFQIISTWLGKET